MWNTNSEHTIDSIKTFDNKLGTFTEFEIYKVDRSTSVNPVYQVIQASDQMAQDINEQR